MIEGIKVVAFDIDGTLYSNTRFYLKVAFYFLGHLKFFHHFNKVRKILHRTAPLADFYEYQARLYAEEMDISVQEAKDTIQKIAYDGLVPYFKNTKPYPYVEEAFRAFKEAGLRLAILSDFPPEQKGNIWNLAQYCDVIIGSEASGALKPSMYPFGTLALKLKVKPEEILYVGNSIRCDVEGSKNAGMKSAYIISGWRRLFGKKIKSADISFKDYRQLKKIVLE
jgi:putative hydrolase of the HAD superfamily